jgi:Holliday junction resolvase RusA-like endonuclease
MIYRYVFRGEVASKKNSKVLARVKGRPMLLPSRKYQEWEKRARLAIMSEGRPPVPLKAARLFMVIYHGDLIKRDSNNATQGVQDVLVDMGVIQDDNWMVIGTPEVSHMVDVQDPRLEVTVEESEPKDWKAIFKAARKSAKKK